MVESGRQLVVYDARQIPFLADNPGIVDLAMIAYAGVPLSAHGYVLGALCVIDAMPHEWSAQDLLVLEDLASACSEEIHLRSALREGRRVRAEQGFRALGDARHEFHHGSPRSPLKTHSQGVAVARERGDDHRRWLRPQPAIPAGAEI